jgi:hypothetical protein
MWIEYSDSVKSHGSDTTYRVEESVTTDTGVAPGIDAAYSKANDPHWLDDVRVRLGVVPK